MLGFDAADVTCYFPRASLFVLQYCSTTVNVFGRKVLGHRSSDNSCNPTVYKYNYTGLG
jgi:hypothetical protein